MWPFFDISSSVEGRWINGRRIHKNDFSSSARQKKPKRSQNLSHLQKIKHVHWKQCDVKSVHQEFLSSVDRIAVDHRVYGWFLSFWGFFFVHIVDNEATTFNGTEIERKFAARKITLFTICDNSWKSIRFLCLSHSNYKLLQCCSKTSSNLHPSRTWDEFNVNKKWQNN